MRDYFCTNGTLVVLPEDSVYKVRIERRAKPGWRQWRVSLDLAPNGLVYWTEREFYGRTRTKAVSKAQRWIARQNRNTYRKEV